MFGEYRPGPPEQSHRPETFRQLVRERGWSPARYERWLVEAAARLLLSR